jgi:hypothetical protein
MRRFLTLSLLVIVLLCAGPASPHAGREFVIAYPSGEAAARTLAHVLGMVALDSLGFDVRILSLPAAQIAAKAASGAVSLAVVPAPLTPGETAGWHPGGQPAAAEPVLWGRFVVPGSELRLMVPSRERKDLRFDAVASVLGKAMARIDLAFFTSLGTIPVAEGKFTGPLRKALEGRGIL